MKRFTSVVMTIILLIGCVGCGSDLSAMRTEKDADSFQKNASDTSGTSHRALQYAESGFYFGYTFKHFCEYGSLSGVALCERAECDHQTGDCDAVFCADFQYYENRLYYVAPADDVFSLCSVSATGGNQRAEMQLRYDNPGATIGDQFLIHRGIVLFVSDHGSVMAAPLGATLGDAKELFHSSPEEEEAWERAGGFNLCGRYAWRLWADGEKFYFMGMPGSLVTDRPYDASIGGDLYCYDAAADSVDKVWSLPDASDVGTWELEGISVSGWYIEDDILTFFLSGNGLWKTNLLTGDTVCVLDSSDDPNIVGNMFCDGKHIFINNSAAAEPGISRSKLTERGIYVFDMDGDYKGTISLEQLYEEGAVANYVQICGSDGSDIVITCDESTKKFYTCSLEDIGYGEWQHIDI